MQCNPLVSIIMNCYNGQSYLKEAIDSIIAQTYQNWEIIFWDNQSIDSSAEIARSYNDNRVKYYYAPEHTILGTARNLAINETKGEWVAFLDCDDLWSENKLKDSMTVLDNHKEKEKASLIYTKTIKIDNLGNTIGKYTQSSSGFIRDSLLKKGNFIVQSSIIVRKTILDKVGGMNSSLSYCPDYDLLLKITKNNIAIGVNKFLTSYRVHNGSVTSKKMYDNYIEEINFMLEYLKKNKLKFTIKVLTKKNIVYRISVFLLKLILKREFKKIAIVVNSYPLYLLFLPIIVPNILINRFKSDLITLYIKLEKMFNYLEI